MQPRTGLLHMKTFVARRTIADVLLDFDIYKGNIVEDLISSQIVHSDSAFDQRISQLLVEPKFSNEYLSKHPINRLIKLTNEFKVVAKRRSKVRF